MDVGKTGAMIRALRLDKGLTQKQLGELIGVSGKAVSKWETGCGYPDISIIPALSKALDVNAEGLISGEQCANEAVSGNMKKLRFYICPSCLNLIIAAGDALICCCGKRLKPVKAQKAQGENMLESSITDNDFYVTSLHPMTKTHYISFVALITADGLYMKKQYPEWNLSCRIPYVGHGMMVYYCVQHGLFYQLV